MPWFVAKTKGVTSGRTLNTEIIKLLEPVSFVKVLQLKQRYHEVEGPYNEWWEAKEAAHKYHVESQHVMAGHHKTVQTGK